MGYLDPAPLPVETGTTIDLGTLGGVWSSATAFNDHGQVVGASNLPGDASQHPYLWDGSRLLDLGTLGGSSGIAWWLNNASARSSVDRRPQTTPSSMRSRGDRKSRATLARSAMTPAASPSSKTNTTRWLEPQVSAAESSKARLHQ